MSQHRRRPPNKRLRRRRLRVLLVSFLAAALAIVGGGYAEARLQTSSAPLASSLAMIPTSHSAALLEQERERMAELDAAARTMSVVSSPRLSTRPTPSPGSSGGIGSPVAAPVYAPVPSPGTAQAIAYRLLPAYGFNAKRQFGCLNNIWSRESGWRVTAANASGAYGIPQALPGSKMASAGPDWQTNATTQIKWGLGYIKSVYGSPCAAWAFWQANGWY